MGRSRIRTVIVAAVLASNIAPAGRAAAAPVNDAFADATVVTALPYSDVVDIATAGAEPLEPNACAQPQHTVWYAYTPAETGAVAIDTAGSTFGTAVNIWRSGASGGPTDLAFIACTSGSPPLNVRTEAAVTYFLQAGGTFSQTGELHLSITAVAPPANDTFADAQPVTATPFESMIDPVAATIEPGEPLPCSSVTAMPSGTVWYAFTPPPGGLYVARGGIDIAAYTGDALDALKLVACDANQQLVLAAEAGTTYRIQVGLGAWGPVRFTLEVAPPPFVDAFWYPFDPSLYDTVRFGYSGYDPLNMPLEAVWTFDDGVVLQGAEVFRTFDADGDYGVSLTVTAPDGRSRTDTDVVQVRTRDLWVTTMRTPVNATAGQTVTVTAGVASRRRTENVEVRLQRGTTSPFEPFTTVATETSVAGERPRTFRFGYTVTDEDVHFGRVVFKVAVRPVDGRDAMPADNDVIAVATSVR